MTQAQKVFESIMRTKGHDNFDKHNNKYVNPGLQVRWNYFQLGWSMKEVTA